LLLYVGFLDQQSLILGNLTNPTLIRTPRKCSIFTVFVHRCDLGGISGDFSNKYQFDSTTARFNKSSPTNNFKKS